MKLQTKIIFSAVFAFILLTSFVVAQSAPTSQPSSSFGNSINEALNEFAQGVEPVFRYTLGDNGGNFDDDTMFIKVIIFFVMLAVLIFAVRRVPNIGENIFIVWILAIALAVLSTRYITSEALVNFIWLPSGVLGIALTSLFPFVIYFFFIESFNSGVIRKTGWVFFTLLYFGLAGARWNDLIVTNFELFGGPFNLGWIYVATAVLSLILIAFDRKIRMMMYRSHLRDITDSTAKKEATRIMIEIDELNKMIAKAPAGTNVDHLIKDRDQWQARLDHILKTKHWP